MTLKVEGAPNPHRRFRVRRDASISSKKPSQMFGGGAPVGAMSFATVGRSCGLRAEPTGPSAVPKAAADPNSRGLERLRLKSLVDIGRRRFTSIVVEVRAAILTCEEYDHSQGADEDYEGAR